MRILKIIEENELTEKVEKDSGGCGRNCVVIAIFLLISLMAFVWFWSKVIW
jgi:hypothetical protein